MVLTVEKKAKWNLSVFESIAKAFDQLSIEAYRGDKGTVASAACLLFMLTPPERRQVLIDVIKLAEGRGIDGNVLEAARKAWGELEASEVDTSPGQERKPRLAAKEHKPRLSGGQ